jgi:hypothetical protein
MRTRLTGVLASVALTLAAAPAALAQGPLPTTTPTPTPTASPAPSATPTPTPTPEEQARAERDAKDRKAKLVKRIYRDFEKDGRIDDCDHTERALKRARRSIEDSYAEEYPDFRDALTAALERHRDGKCVEATPTPSPTASPAPGGTGTTPAPPPAATTAPPPPPSSTPDSGTLPGFGGGSTGGSKGGGSGKDTFTPPGEGDIPEGTLPSPTPTATPQALPPKLVVTRAGTAPSLFVPGSLLAIALLGLLIAAMTGLFAKRTGRLAGVGHAWREASWRASGTWSEFTDWLRTGR